MDTRALELLRTMVNSLSVGVELFPAPAVVVVMVMDDLQGLVAIISTVASRSRSRSARIPTAGRPTHSLTACWFFLSFQCSQALSIAGPGRSRCTCGA